VCVSLIVIRCNNNLLLLQVGRRGQTKKKERKKERKKKKERKTCYGVYSPSIPGTYYRSTTLILLFHLCLVLLSSLLMSDFTAITLQYPIFLYAILLILILNEKKRI